MKQEKMYHFVYEITNLINQKIYRGKHSTNDVNDGYLGTGSVIPKVIKKYGKENFQREILQFFDTEEEAYLYEAEIVNKEFVLRKDTYNYKLGGEGGFSGMVNVQDKEGKALRIFNDDPQFLSGELVSIFRGKVVVKDENENTFQISTDDPRYLNGELNHHATGTVVVKDNEDNKNKAIVLGEFYQNPHRYEALSSGRMTVKDRNENTFSVSTNDLRFLNGELVHIAKGKVTAKDKNGCTSQVSINDPRYLSGELVSIHKGVHLSEETKRKISLFQKGKIVSEETKRKISKTKQLNPYHHTNETKQKLKETHTGKVHTQEQNEAQSLRMQGRNNHFYGKHHTDEVKQQCGINKGTVYVNKDGINKRIQPAELESYLNLGYNKGLLKKSNKGSYWIHKGTESKMVFQEEIDDYLAQGFKRGRGTIKKNKI